MTQQLLKKFVPNAEQTDLPQVRGAYGTLSSIVGISCNLLLFILKFAVGTLAHSVSILSDAFNNLSDAAGCIVTLFAYKLAAKPADKDHPFGHGRMEYLTSLLISVLIILVGYELLQEAIDKLLHPQEVWIHPAVFVVLIFSILVKLWLFRFNLRLGRKISSQAMLATAKDSRNDVIATTAAGIGLIASHLTTLPVDGAMGLLVSLFIFKTGLEIIRDTLDDLLGRPADPDTVQQIKELVCCNDRILGLHDLVIHNYGPGKIIGSCHAEIRSTENLLSIHDLIDRIERNIEETLHIQMTIHMDPVETDHAETNRCRELITTTLQHIDSSLSIHDFRIVPGETHTNLIFDVVIPFDCKKKPDEIRQALKQRLASEPIHYELVITFDQSYV